MKKIPLTTIPVLLFILMLILFSVAVPKGEDLISPTGDYVVGQIIGIFFVVCIILDVRRWRNKNKQPHK